MAGKARPVARGMLDVLALQHKREREERRKAQIRQQTPTFPSYPDAPVDGVETQVAFFPDGGVTVTPAGASKPYYFRNGGWHKLGGLSIIRPQVLRAEAFTEDLAPNTPSTIDWSQGHSPDGAAILANDNADNALLEVYAASPTPPMDLTYDGLSYNFDFGDDPTIINAVGATASPPAGAMRYIVSAFVKIVHITTPGEPAIPFSIEIAILSGHSPFASGNRSAADSRMIDTSLSVYTTPQIHFDTEIWPNTNEDGFPDEGPIPFSVRWAHNIPSNVRAVAGLAVIAQSVHENGDIIQL